MWLLTVLLISDALALKHNKFEGKIPSQQIINKNGSVYSISVLFSSGLLLSASLNLLTTNI